MTCLAAEGEKHMRKNGKKERGGGAGEVMRVRKPKKKNTPWWAWTQKVSSESGTGGEREKHTGGFQWECWDSKGRCKKYVPFTSSHRSTSGIRVLEDRRTAEGKVNHPANGKTGHLA